MHRAAESPTKSDSCPSPTRSRTRGRRTATGPMPVTISRSANARGAPLAGGHQQSACRHGRLGSPQPRPPQRAPTALTPWRKISVNGSVNVPGWESLITLSWVTAYHCFSGEVEASNTPTIRRLTPSSRHQLPRIAHLTPEGWRHVLVPRAGGEDCSPAR